MNIDHRYHEGSAFFELMMALPFVVMLVMYIGAAIVSSQYNHLRKWPLHRYVFWIFGVVCAAAAVVGPLADQAHYDFIAHMIGHLLLGMMAPLLLVLAAPMTLFLRTVNVQTARRLSRILKAGQFVYLVILL